MDNKGSKIVRDGQAIVVQKNVMSVDEQGKDQLTTMTITTTSTVVPPENPKENQVKPANRVDLPAGNNAREKYVYLVEAKPAFARTGRFFITSRVDKGSGYVEFIGIELDTSKYWDMKEDLITNLKNKTSYDEIMDYVNKIEVKLVSMFYPLNEIHCVQNLTYNKKR